MREGRENGPAPEAGAEGSRDRGEEGFDARASVERRADLSERRARAEASAEARGAKERIAEALWKDAASFADYAAESGIGPELSRFLGEFGRLDDEALPTDALRAARDAAARAAREGGA